MFLRFIFLGIINFSSQGVKRVVWFPLFFPLSWLSLIYFSLCSYHNSFLGHHKVGMSHLPPFVVAHKCFGPYALNHTVLVLCFVWKEKEILDTLPLELMAKLWTTFFFFFFRTNYFTYFSKSEVYKQLLFSTMIQFSKKAIGYHLYHS
jgi:hypothetical protein